MLRNFLRNVFRSLLNHLAGYPGVSKRFEETKGLCSIFGPYSAGLSSLGFERRNLGRPGNSAGMSCTPGGVQKFVQTKKVFVPFSAPKTDLFPRVLFSFLPPWLATPLSPSKRALFCRAKGTAQSLERGSLRMDLSTKFGKEIPSRNLREKKVRRGSAVFCPTNSREDPWGCSMLLIALPCPCVFWAQP